MRLILSRKGFDSALGGAASPIFPDGTMTSLPIPLDGAPTTYAQIVKGPEASLGPIVADLTRGAITGAMTAHLDPDLANPALDRKSTRLNSSHANISYAVFCLKKKTINSDIYYTQ